MTSVLKSTLLGLGLLAGAAATVQAQSVATAPPNGTAGQTAYTWPYGSTQSFYPKPGGSEVITQQPPAGYVTNQAEPNSTSANASQPTAGGGSTGPYSGGVGLKPN